MADSLSTMVKRTSISFEAPATLPARVRQVAAWVERTGNYAPEGGRKPTRSYIYRLAVEIGLRQLEKEAKL